MADVEVYTVENSAGETIWGDALPMSELIGIDGYDAAKTYASDNHGRVVCNTYVFSDSEMLDDYTESDEEDNEEDKEARYQELVSKFPNISSEEESELDLLREHLGHEDPFVNTYDNGYGPVPIEIKSED